MSQSDQDCWVTAAGLVPTVEWCVMAPLATTALIWGGASLPAAHMVEVNSIATPLVGSSDEVGRFALPARPPLFPCVALSVSPLVLNRLTHSYAGVSDFPSFTFPYSGSQNLLVIKVNRKQLVRTMV